jgi:aryl-phospho-beta-D-glucosidase BglC (GH1 family)
MTLPSRRDFLVSALTATFAKPLLAAPLASPVSHEGGVAAHRALLLNRGVNLSGWYGGWGEYSPAHLSTWTTPADLAFIRAAGLQYVRLCIDPVQLTAGGFDSADSTAALARLDKSIDDILAAGLGLSITLFPKSDYKQALLTPDGAGAFLTLWKFLATHFASRNPDRVFFDLLNEPEIDDAVRWNALQARVVEAIRSVDQRHTLIATGNRFAGIDELLLISPLSDKNVVYTFHFYEPFPFTHQGATWTQSALARLKHVPYPGDPEKLGPMVASASDPGVRDELAGYAAGAWDRTTIRQRLKQARTWADAHGVTVICNEFGAFRDTIPQAERAVYLADVRTSLEFLAIPWAAWDYRGNFGFVTHDEDGSIVPEIPIMQALGLTLPAPVTAPVAPAAAPSTAPPATSN